MKVYRGQELWEKREECIVRNLMRTSLEKVHGPAQKIRVDSDYENNVETKCTYGVTHHHHRQC